MPVSRLDVALVDRGLARSRGHAARLIAARKVTVAGVAATKPAVAVADGQEIGVAADDDWASRGAYKLLGALDAFDVPVADRTALDAGASHGGFTDVLLRRDVRTVAAVDVGHGQLRPHLAADHRVAVLDGVNVRALRPDAVTAVLGGPADLVVADLSFISLPLVLPALVACAHAGSDVLPMVKPQFEVGRTRLGAHGVVRDPARRAEAVRAVAAAAAALGWGLAGAVAAPLPGPSGNVEYFLHLRRDASTDAEAAAALVHRAITEGPADGRHAD